VVTGAARGIGFGIAASLGALGAKVLIVDCEPDAAAEAAASLQQRGYWSESLVIDLANEDSVVRGCAAICDRHGPPWLLVNNAAVLDRELLLDVTTSEWDRVLAINARGPMMMTRELGLAMVAAGRGGRIVNIASNSVRQPSVKGLASYAASKGALLALSLTSAFELAEHGITVNTVLPGGVATPGAIHARGPAPEGPGRRRPPLGMCEPGDIAGAVLFFASRAARYVTNQVITVDGGHALT
jgi:NAD(P)-dependent dehydrogenase (short-subunit alcohol dehydrogenase family)